MSVSYVVGFLILTAGHTELLVTLVNRLHAQPIRGSVLRHARHVHDLLIPAFPVVLLVATSFFLPEVFNEPIGLVEIWTRLPVVVQGYFTICGLGFLGLTASIARYWLKRTPAQQLAYSATVLDVAGELGFSPVGRGPFRFLTRFPRNECFQIELARRIVQLPRLPREWDALRILHISDLHFTGTIDLPYFRSVMKHIADLKPDIAIFTGDLLDDMEFITWIPETLGQICAPGGRYFVLGNHDWNLDAARIRQALCESGWRDISGSTALLNRGDSNLRLAGSERPWMGVEPEFPPAPENEFRILVTHTPDNFSWARRNRVDLMLAGHNHGGQVVLPLVGPVFSPSVHGCQFSGGLFWKDPCLLHVSRGVSGVHPLRLFCRPEVTLIELRCQTRA